MIPSPKVLDYCDKDTSHRPDVPCTLAEAQEIINKLSPTAAEHGLFIGLTGSVLFKGRSESDLDLVLYPAQTGKGYSFTNFLDAVAPDRTLATPYHEYDEKIVWCCELFMKQVDFFCLT